MIRDPGRGEALLDAAYEAPFHADGWEPFLRELSQQLQVAALGISARAEDGSWVEQTWLGLDPAYERAYVEHFHRLDPWAIGGRSAPTGICALGSTFVPDDVFQRSEFYQDLCVPYGLTDFLGAIVDRSLDGVMVSLGLIRSPSIARFDEEDRSALSELVPHLRRVEGLRRAAVQARRVGGGDALDALTIPVFVVDDECRVKRVNRAAEAILAECDGLQMEAGLLRASHRADTDRLRLAVLAALRELTVGDSTRSFTVRRPSERPSDAVIVVADRRDGRLTGLANVFVLRPDGLLPSAALLRRTYGLTPAEARLAEAMGAGLSPKEVAARHDVSWNTVRTQLRSVFAKTGTDRQATLVRLLVSLGVIRETE